MVTAEMKEICEYALRLLAEDNGLRRNSTPVEITSEIGQQAISIYSDSHSCFSDFICGAEEDKVRILRKHNAVDFDRWLEQCFNGDLARTYFDLG